MRRKHGKGRGKKKKEKKKLREPVIGPLTESDAWMQMFEENITVEVVGKIGGPELENYLVDLAFQLWQARPIPDKEAERPPETPGKSPRGDLGPSSKA